MSALRVTGSGPRPSAADLAPVVVARTVELAEMPAPTGHEGNRAARVADWWRHDGLGAVHHDRAGNVWAEAVAGTGAAVVLAAHLDTVFAGDADHTVHRRGLRLHGPGVGDNAVAVAALAAVGALVASGVFPPPTLLVGTVGEEGLGNLSGVTAALAEPPRPVGALVALEGNYLGRVGTVGVGSSRWRVTVTGPGGHAWEAASAPSAVHEVSRLIAALAAIEVEPGRRSVNVGWVRGGEAVNARAVRATFVVDLRAADPGELEDLVARCRSVWTRDWPDAVTVHAEEVGRRPAGRIEDEHPLVRAAVDALRRAGRRPSLVATSTDANAAHAAGIPAVALGVTVGAGEHTMGEWIDVGPVATGLQILAETVIEFGGAGG